MNQKDYKAIANILNRWEYDWESICIELADYFEKEANPFNKKEVFLRNQFLKDCGVTE